MSSDVISEILLAGRVRLREGRFRARAAMITIFPFEHLIPDVRFITRTQYNASVDSPFLENTRIAIGYDN